MQSPLKQFQAQDVERRSFEMPDFQMPKVDFGKVDLSKVEMPKVDVSKVDVGKAVADAAVAVGLARHRRSRWPFALGAIVAVGAASWIVANRSMLQERLLQARYWITERVGEMRSDAMERDHEAVAFTAAEPMPIEPSPYESVPESLMTDYPEGLGTPDASAPNGRERVSSSR